MQKFVPKVSIDNKSAFVQVITWHETGDKPLPEPNLTSLGMSVSYLRKDLNYLGHVNV